jgi:Uma2 family endonuclease
MLYSEPMSYPTAKSPRRHRYTVADFERMEAAGILAPDARVELIDGEIIDMAPIGSEHVATLAHFDHLLRDAVRTQAIVLVQAPIALDDFSAPQPDLVLLRPRDDYYRSALARPADVLLIVEVAMSSLRYDRKVKVPLYARHDIPETWLIDAERLKLTRYRTPLNGVYTRIDEPPPASPVAIELLPDARLDLSPLLRDGQRLTL